MATESKNRFVYTTLVMKGDKYIPGALCLAKSLRNHGTKYPIWCMIDAEVSIEAHNLLTKYYDRVVLVPLLRKDVIPMRTVRQNKIYSSWIDSSFTKWHIMNPKLFQENGIPYEKVLFMDADMLALANLDELFDLPAPAATFSMPWAKPYNPRGIYSPYGDPAHGAEIPIYKIKKGLNSLVELASVVLQEPSMQSWNFLIEMLNKPDIYGHNMCFSGFDEQILADVWIDMNVPVHHIHPKYNWVVGKYEWLRYSDKTAEPLTYHFYNIKPWEQKRDAWEECVAWWTVADEIVKETNGAASNWFKIRQPDIHYD